MTLLYTLHPHIRVLPCPQCKRIWEERLLIVSLDARLGRGDTITQGELATIDDEGAAISTSLTIGAVASAGRSIEAIASGGVQGWTYLIRARVWTLQGDRHEGKVILRIA